VQLLVDDADRAPRDGSRGYDFSADPFDPTRPCNDPADPWSANCAIPNLLFDDLGRFRARYPESRSWTRACPSSSSSSTRVA